MPDWIQVLRPNPSASVRFFGIPYAGGGASWFRTWNDLFPATIEVNAVQLPGREGRLREPALTTVRAVIEPLVKAIEPKLDRPFVVYGHSLGAMLAFELVRGLRASGRQLPASLAVSGRLAPHLPLRFAPIHALPQAEFIRVMGQRHQAIPQQVLDEPELLQLVLPTLRSDLKIAETHEYVDELPLDVPIFAAGGNSDFLVSEEEVKGWSRHTTAPFRTEIFEGGHFFVNDIGTRRALAAKIVEGVKGLI